MFRTYTKDLRSIRLYGQSGSHDFFQAGTSEGDTPLQPPPQDVIDIVDMIISTDHSKNEAVKLVSLLHRYARENLLLANIYIKDPAVTLIKRDQVPTFTYLLTCIPTFLPTHHTPSYLH